MSSFLVRAAVVLALPGLAAAQDCSTPRPQVLVERFVAADCAACWAAQPPSPQPPPPRGARAFVLDWIVPGAKGDDAPLAVAALPEARERLGRDTALRDDETLVQSTPLAQPSALHVEVLDGPAWNGYIGVQFKARYDGARPLPPRLEGWLAVIEVVPAGSEGSPVERRLVRRVAGPLPLAALARREAVEHLRAVRVPDNARPERLASVGWVQTTAGKVLAVAERRDPRCP